MNPVRFMATKSKFMPSTLGKRAGPLVAEVLVDLTVEGERPCEEVDPPDDRDYELLPGLHMLDRFIISDKLHH